MQFAVLERRFRRERGDDFAVLSGREEMTLVLEQFPDPLAGLLAVDEIALADHLAGHGVLLVGALVEVVAGGILADLRSIFILPLGYSVAVSRLATLKCPPRPWPVAALAVSDAAA